MFSSIHFKRQCERRSHAPFARINRIAVAVASAWLAMSAQAQTAVTLPEVAVTAAPVADDEFISQGRQASVGKNRASIQDTPFSISVIDAKQAAETGATNIESALLYSAGVYAGRYGFDTRGDWAAIRGLSPSAYVDGLRGIYGYYNNVRPEFYTLERVEVLKGPSSVLYGQAELGGIINAVSKLPKSTPSREVEVQIGSHNRKQVGIDFTGPANEDGTLLYRLVALKRDSDTQVDYVNDDAVVLMPSLTWRPDADTSVTVMYTYQKNESKVSSQFLPMQGTLVSGSQGFIPSSRFAGEPSWDRYDTKKNELTLLGEHRLNETWNVKANLRKTNSSSVTKEIYARVGSVPDAAGNMQRTISAADRSTDVWAADVRLEGDLRLGPTRHRVTAGLDYQNALWTEDNYISATLPGTFNVYNPVYGTINPNSYVGVDRPDNKIIQTGVYLMDHMEWGPWVLSGAVRRDQADNQTITPGAGTSSVKNGATTGQLGLMYRFANGISPYVSTSEAFVPNLGTDGAGGYLKPTTGSQDEVGIKYLAPSGNTSIALASFNIKQKNRVVAGATPGGQEQVGSVIDGWEIEARHRMGRLELLGNYTDLSALNDATRTRLSSVAERTASAWAQYHFTGGWRAGVGSRYIGDVTGASGVPVAPSVTLYDAMVGYSIGQWDFRLNMQNIGDKEYVSWCRGLNQDCGYGSRRNVLLTANFKF
ncbi:MAG TPA: TonB-dependent siderophore receptor [Rhodocyclaceae bacterium]|nr:TonB-dependent siderophore receptor [Rhodocyclaceae bacterium]